MDGVYGIGIAKLEEQAFCTTGHEKPQWILPGRYACQEVTGDYSRILTFQTIGELNAHLESIEARKRKHE